MMIWLLGDLISHEMNHALAGRVSVIIPGIFVAETSASTPVITDANFHQIVYVRRGTGSTHEIWIDGVNVPLSVNLPNAFIDSGEAKLIGARQTSAQLWKGKIDEVTVWNRALSSSEISSLYNSGTGCVL